MCVPPIWLVATPWLVPILLRSLVKVRGSSPRRESSPLLILPTPEGWKAEYTLASRMQIHESLTVLALLARGEAPTGDPWICRLMLYHLSYLTTYIHTYIHTISRDNWKWKASVQTTRSYQKGPHRDLVWKRNKNIDKGGEEQAWLSCME